MFNSCFIILAIEIVYGFQKACCSSLLLHILCLKHITDVIMTETSPGPSAAVELVSRQEARIIKLCIICQKVKDSNGNSKLSSTPEGREKIVQTSNLLNDDLLINIPESNLYSLQYHVKTCYARYIKTGERYKQKTSTRTPICSRYILFQRFQLRRSI